MIELPTFKIIKNELQLTVHDVAHALGNHVRPGLLHVCLAAQAEAAGQEAGHGEALFK